MYAINVKPHLIAILFVTCQVQVQNFCNRSNMYAINEKSHLTAFSRATCQVQLQK